MVWTGLMWFRIGTRGRLLWTRCWTFGFHKMLGRSWVAAQFKKGSAPWVSKHETPKSCIQCLVYICLHWIRYSVIFMFVATNTEIPGSIPGVARFLWAAVGLERGPLSLVNNFRSYLEEIVAVPGLENRSYDRRDSLRWPRDTLYPLKLALASLTGGDRLIRIVR
jgi:hypothetical protein